MFRSAAFALALVTLLSACKEEQDGHGIGRPVATPGDGVEQAQPLAITEVYLQLAVGDTASVTIDVDDATCAAPCSPISLDTMQLCGQLDCVALAGNTPQILSGTTLDPLQLNSAADELAVIDSNGTVHAYLAWGAAPELLGSRFAAAAVFSGAAAPGDYVPLPFPMTTGVAVAVQNGSAGCAAPGGAIDPALCPQVAPIMQILEVKPQHDGEPTSWIEIQISDVTVPLFGARICLPPFCAVFGRDATPPADGHWMVFLGQDAPDPPVDGELYLPDMRPAFEDDELLLLAPGSSNLAEPSDIQAYLRFGNIDSGLAASASDVGLWSGVGDSVAAPRFPGESVSLSLGGDATLAGDWAPTEATPDADNLVITAANDIWTSCSAPKFPAAPSPLVVASLQTGSPAVVELRNRGDLTIRLEGIELLIDDASFSLATLALEQSLAVAIAPTERLTVTLPDGVAIGVSGALLLRDDGVAIQSVRWGGGGVMDASEAVAAGIWPELALPQADGTTKHLVCSMDAIAPADTIELLQERIGYSPADYRVP